jgi:hypothetical protein
MKAASSIFSPLSSFRLARLKEKTPGQLGLKVKEIYEICFRIRNHSAPPVDAAGPDQ